MIGLDKLTETDRQRLTTSDGFGPALTTTTTTTNNNNILIAESRRRLRPPPTQPRLWTEQVIKVDPETASGGNNILKTWSQCINLKKCTDFKNLLTGPYQSGA